VLPPDDDAEDDEDEDDEAEDEDESLVELLLESPDLVFSEAFPPSVPGFLA
jgi:hypothetical protein